MAGDQILCHLLGVGSYQRTTFALIAILIVSLIALSVYAEQRNGYSTLNTMSEIEESKSMATLKKRSDACPAVCRRVACACDIGRTFYELPHCKSD